MTGPELEGSPPMYNTRRTAAPATVAQERPPEELMERARAAAVDAKRAGDFAPTFRLPDIHGGNHALIDLIDDGPLILSFYRGVWCGSCDNALDSLGRIDATIRGLGATHVAIGPAPGDEVQRARLEALPMPVLIDRGLKVTRSYGLAITLPISLHEQYAGFGYVAAKGAHPGEWLISVPATYVIGRFGKVALATIDVDYRNRATPSELISAIKGVRAHW